MTTKPKFHVLSAADLMATGAETYRKRNKLYGNNYHTHGDVMMALFPNGVTLETREAHNRFGILTQLAAKMTRYAAQWEAGGHVDSAHDIMVYGAMLEELTR